MDEEQKYSLDYEDEFVSIKVNAVGSPDYWTNPKELIDIVNALVEHSNTWPVFSIEVKSKRQDVEDEVYEFNPVDPVLGD